MKFSITARLVAGLLAFACAAPAFAQSATRTRLLSTPNPSQFGQNVELTAEVDGLGGGPPTGNVIFKDGATTLGVGALVAPGAGQQAMALGFQHTCALTSAGNVQCSGFNDFGQLGDGTTTSRTVPANVIGLPNDIVAISSGSGFHTCALSAAGAVFCWGLNNVGQLGDGTFNQRLQATPVVGLPLPAVAIAAGRNHSCALMIEGAVYCWGANSTGQLGDGSLVNSNTPLLVVSLDADVVAVSAGGAHTCARTKGGAARCWGGNSSGQLGDGSLIDRTAAVTPSGLETGVADITAGGLHTCAVTTSGNVLCWGLNFFGAIGDGGTTNRPTPTANGLSNIATVAAGKDHSCALTRAGAVLCWGANSVGQIGDGTSRNNRLVPTAVTSSASGRVAVAAGGTHSCALTSGGALQCWGLTFGNTPVVVLNALIRARARLTATGLASGNHPLTAQYDGDDNHFASSDARNHVVSPARTSIALSVSPAPATFGQTVTILARITSAVGTPTGNVTFFVDDTPAGAAPLNAAGVARVTATPPAGTHQWRAEYAGQGVFAASSSANVAHIVNKAPAAIALSTSINPTVFSQPFDLIARVTLPLPGSGRRQDKSRFWTVVIWSRQPY